MVRVSSGWTDSVPSRAGKKSTVWDVAYKPDGTELIVAASNRVLIYDAVDGDLLKRSKVTKTPCTPSTTRRTVRCLHLEAPIKWS